MRWLWLWGVLAVTPAAAAEGVGQAWGLVLGEVERGRPAGGVLFDGAGAPVPGSAYAPVLGGERVGLAVGLAGELELGGGWSVFGAVDSGLLTVEGEAVWSSGRPFGDELRETWLVRAAGVEWLGPQGVSVVVGKRRVLLGRGVLIDAPALGGELSVEQEPFAVRAGAWWPGRDVAPRGWPVVRLEAAWRPDPFVEVRGFWAATRFAGAEGRAAVLGAVEAGVTEGLLAVLAELLAPRSGAAGGAGGERVADALAVLARCAGVETRLTPWWAGFEGEALLDGHTLSGVVLIGRGRGRVALAVDDACPRWAALAEGLVAPRVFDFDAAGAQLAWRMYVAEWLYVGAFGLATTGNVPESGGRTPFTALVAPAPFVPRPSLLLGGGLGAGLVERPAVTYGYGARGVLAPGVTALWVPHAAVEVDGAWSPLWSAVEGPHGGWFYGHELDGRLRWSPAEALQLSLDGAVLWTGDFFPAGGPWWRVGLAVEVAAP